MFAFMQPSFEKTLFDDLVRSNSLSEEKQKICWEALKKAKLLQCKRRNNAKKNRRELCSQYMEEFSQKDNMTTDQKSVVTEFLEKVRAHVSKEEDSGKKELSDAVYLQHLEEKSLTLKQKQAVSAAWAELRSFLSDGYLYMDLKIYGIFADCLKRVHFTEPEQDSLFSALNDLVYEGSHKKLKCNFIKKLFKRDSQKR